MILNGSYYMLFRVIRKNINLFVLLFALLFNIQTGLTHGVEHFFHASDTEHSPDVEKCLLESNVTKSNDLSDRFHVQISNDNQFYDHYYLGTQPSYRFFAYQSRGP